MNIRKNAIGEILGKYGADNNVTSATILTGDMTADLMGPSNFVRGPVQVLAWIGGPYIQESAQQTAVVDHMTGSIVTIPKRG